MFRTCTSPTLETQLETNAIAKKKGLKVQKSRRDSTSSSEGVDDDGSPHEYSEVDADAYVREDGLVL